LVIVVLLPSFKVVAGICGKTVALKTGQTLLDLSLTSVVINISENSSKVLLRFEAGYV